MLRACGRGLLGFFMAQAFFFGRIERFESAPFLLALGFFGAVLAGALIAFARTGALLITHARQLVHARLHAVLCGRAGLGVGFGHFAPFGLGVLVHLGPVRLQRREGMLLRRA